MLQTNLIDRIVGLFNPMSGLKRVTAREILNRAYSGAKPEGGFRPRRPGASANTDHQMDARTLRIRARALVQNTPYIARGLGSLQANLIGTGITPRSMAIDAKTIDALWNAWGKVADADGRLDIYGMQAAAYRAMEQDGEVLIRLRARRPEDNMPVPLQLQLLEIDWLDSTKNTIIQGNTVINGIEYDAIGKVVAYWLYDRHPGEMLAFRRGISASHAVLAEDIIHLYHPERPGQGRGISRLAPVITLVRDLTVYEDAEIARKNLETRLSVIASGDPSILADPNTPVDSDEGVRKTGKLGNLNSGSIIHVPSGLNLTVVQPTATPGYVDYVKQQLHIIAAGMGITYEMLTGDVREVNFSSARVALLEFRRCAEQLQWHIIIPKLCEPIWKAFINAAHLNKIIPKADHSCGWSTPRWSYVNPVQDVASDLDEISGGLSSISAKIRNRGDDPDAVFAELKTDLERLQADGTLDFLVMLQKGRTLGMAQAESSAKPAA